MKMLTSSVLMVMTLILGSVPCVSAGSWVGENGLVRLSFTEGEELQAISNVPEGRGGITLVDVYAYLTDVDPVKLNGEFFLGLGAMELTLVIDGGDGIITSQTYPVACHSMGRKSGEVIGGLPEGILLEENGTLLVHWQVMFKEHPKNVVFSLDNDGGITRHRHPEIKAAQPYALYIGMVVSGQTGSLFGAGCVPAYLNYEGEPDLTPLHGKESWQEVGVYEEQ